MAETKIVVGPQPFSVGEEYPWLAERDEDGAVVTFTGKVRNHNLGDSVNALTLEHYPGMTEKALAEIVDEAHQHLCGDLLSPGTLAQSVRQPDGKQGQHNYDCPAYHSGFRNRYSAEQRNLERNMGLQFGIQFRFDFTQRASPRLSISWFTRLL